MKNIQEPDIEFVNEKINHLEKTPEENLEYFRSEQFDKEGLTETEIMQILTDCINISNDVNSFSNIAVFCIEKLSNYTLAREMFQKAESLICEFYEYPDLAYSILKHLKDLEWGLKLLEKAKAIADEYPKAIRYIVIADEYCRFTDDKVKCKELYQLAEKYATTTREYNRLISSVLDIMNDKEYYMELVDKANMLEGNPSRMFDFTALLKLIDS